MRDWIVLAWSREMASFACFAGNPYRPQIYLLSSLGFPKGWGARRAVVAGFELPFMRDDILRDFADASEWELALKAAAAFRAVDIRLPDTPEFRVASSVVACGDLSILSVDAPTPFVCERYQLDAATVYLPYCQYSVWTAADQAMVGRHGESVLYCAPGAEMSVQSDGSSGVLVMILHAALVQHALELSCGTLFVSPIRSRLQRSQVLDRGVGRNADLIAALYGCLFTLNRVHEGSPESLQQLSLDQTFLRLLLMLLFPELRAPDQLSSAYKPKLARMKELEEWILMNLSSPISLEQLEAVSGYSSRTLRDYFVTHHGESPKQWIIQQRLTKALQILSSGDDRSMSEIALDCGYRDPSRFSRHFQKQFGLQPRHCRNADPESEAALES